MSEISLQDKLDKIQSHKKIRKVEIKASFDIYSGGSLQILKNTGKQIHLGFIYPVPRLDKDEGYFVAKDNLLFLEHEYQKGLQIEQTFSTLESSTVFEHVIYTPLAIEAAETQKIVDETIFEPGCADGSPEIACKNKGAMKLIGFDLSETWRRRYYQTIKNNGLQKEDFIYHKQNICEVDTCVEWLKPHNVSGMIANIGAWYPDDAHLKVIEIAAQLPTVNWVVSGGYIQPDERYDDQKYYPDTAIQCLEQNGFKVTQFFTANVSFVARGMPLKKRGPGLCMLAKRC